MLYSKLYNLKIELIQYLNTKFRYEKITTGVFYYIEHITELFLRKKFLSGDLSEYEYRESKEFFKNEIIMGRIGIVDDEFLKDLFKKEIYTFEETPEVNTERFKSATFDNIDSIKNWDNVKNWVLDNIPDGEYYDSYDHSVRTVKRILKQK